ncbi:radical SAM protein [Geitlerinema sp. P-1104]|uniref:viperin family antiviral radical SAM protein n=1 Tax=Geitlerinema sp. P-1104 TaxID=2546230 RepID=UPI0014769FBF|nr:viperin family antiviral radical SAM protein [Geitlerinema sp. P-1104]NMG58845.1 radical SAM protein [Geitlerinema sp. P-1104]
MVDSPVKITPLVINWHLLEPCNFHCRYCYAQWNKAQLPLVFKDRHLSEKLIREIASLQPKSPYLRLSFAGGEPLLDTDISHKIDFSYNLGIQSSIITNGSLLSRNLNLEIVRKLSMLGISIDSASKPTNQKIGRGFNRKSYNYESLLLVLDSIRKNNPNLKIKINTVVNQFNWNENLSEFIMRINPDKWKVLRVLPATPRSKTEAISNEQYERFKVTHNHIPFAQFEDNSDMTCSYLMIDPYGRFFYNSEEGYKYTESILKIGMETALRKVNFDYGKFSLRYQK